MPAQRVGDAVLAYSVGHGTSPSVQPSEVIVLLPQPALGEVAEPCDIRLGRAFEIAEAMIAKGSRVRLVASGASLSDTWPAWVKTTSGFVTTELGAYRLVNPIVATRDLAGEVHDWLEGVAGHLGRDASQMLYASLVNRCLQPLFDATSYITGLAAIHPDATFVLADDAWIGAAHLRKMVAPTGGTIIPPAAGRRSRWRAAITGRLILQLAAGVIGQLRLYWLSGPSRRLLRRRFRNDSPNLWLALQPDWPRINRHLLAELAGREQDYGILLTTTLRAGDVTAPRHAGPLWPAIPDDVKSLSSSIVLDSVAGPTTLGMLLGGLVRGCVAAARAWWRLLTTGHDLLDRAGGLAASSIAGSIAKLLTVDVIQATLIGDATRAVAARRRLAGSIVVFTNLNVVDTAAAEVCLRQAGAWTIDFKHGSGGGGWFGANETFAHHVLAWAAADASLTALVPRPAMILQPPTPPAIRPAKTIRHLLVLTAYNHDGWQRSGFPLRPFEIELMRGLAMLQADHPDLSIRWRPHPSDDPTELDDRMSRFPFLQRLPGSDLAEDLDWADVAITYGGSTLGQTVRAGLPVILHAVPAMLTYPDHAAIDPDRRFFYAADLVPTFHRLETAFLEGTDAAADIDRQAFDRLFKPSADTATVVALDFPDRERPAPQRG